MAGVFLSKHTQQLTDSQRTGAGGSSRGTLKLQLEVCGLKDSVPHKTGPSAETWANATNVGSVTEYILAT